MAITFTELLAKQLFTEAFNGLKKYLEKKGIHLLRQPVDIQNAIQLHLKNVHNWSKQVKFNDMEKSKELKHIYVQLDYYLTPVRYQLTSQDTKEKKVKLSNILKEDNHSIILGQPGAGKTTTVQYLCQSIIFNENFHAEKFHFPIVIRLRELSDYGYGNNDEQFLIFDTIFKILGLKVKMDDQLTKEYTYSNIQECVLKILDELKIVIILDGFDEIYPEAKRDKVLREIKLLMYHLSCTKVILTSRTGDFSHISIENATIFEISPLDDSQIKSFVVKWIRNEKKSSVLIQNILKSPFHDTAVRPLTLAHLCAIFNRYNSIPEQPQELYKKIVSLYVEDWDIQRGIKMRTKHIQLSNNKVFDLLCTLSFYLSIDTQSLRFNKKTLEKTFKEVGNHFGILEENLSPLLNQLESNTGLLIQSGVDTFEFSHKSIQEYLTAEYMVKLPSTPADKRVILMLPNEFAIAIAISSDPTMYFCDFVFNMLPMLTSSMNPQYYSVFINRLQLEKPAFRLSEILGAAFMRLNFLAPSGSKHLIDRIYQSNDTIKSSIRLTYKKCIVNERSQGNVTLTVSQPISEMLFKVPNIDLLASQQWIQ